MQINIQPIEKADRREDGAVEVHSIFSTIQGEGPFVGHPAIFVRLAGCNLQCPACDTDYTSSRALMSPPVVYDYIQEQLLASSTAKLIVITGGEPFRQNLVPLVFFLLGKGLKVQIETNGSLYQELPWKGQGDNLTVVCSPKTGKLNKDLVPHIKAFKYVVKTGDMAADGLPVHALDHSVADHVARPPAGFPRERVYVQPIDTQSIEENQAHTQAAINSCLKFGYTLCLQTHKITNLP